MKLPHKIRHFENLHILLWLIKDSCWLMQWKLAGTIVFFPTLFMAIYICFNTRHSPLSLLVNLSVLCWISANSSWMFEEFYAWNTKPMALTFFGIGLIFIFIYLYQVFVRNAEDEEV
jgi:hypothetical protein